MRVLSIMLSMAGNVSAARQKSIREHPSPGFVAPGQRVKLGICGIDQQRGVQSWVSSFDKWSEQLGFPADSDGVHPGVQLSYIGRPYIGYKNMADLLDVKAKTVSPEFQLPWTPDNADLEDALAWNTGAAADLAFWEEQIQKWAGSIQTSHRVAPSYSEAERVQVAGPQWPFIVELMNSHKAFSLHVNSAGSFDYFKTLTGTTGALNKKHAIKLFRWMVHYYHAPPSDNSSSRQAKYPLRIQVNFPWHLVQKVNISVNGENGTEFQQEVTETWMLKHWGKLAEALVEIAQGQEDKVEFLLPCKKDTELPIVKGILQILIEANIFPVVWLDISGGTGKSIAHSNSTPLLAIVQELLPLFQEKDRHMQVGATGGLSAETAKATFNWLRTFDMELEDTTGGLARLALTDGQSGFRQPALVNGESKRDRSAGDIDDRAVDAVVAEMRDGQHF